MIEKLKLLQRIGESVCEGCGFSNDCGIEPLKCQRINSAIAALDKYVNAEIETTGSESPSVTGYVPELICTVCLEAYEGDEGCSFICDDCGQCGFCEECVDPENHDCE